MAKNEKKKEYDIRYQKEHLVQLNMRMLPEEKELITTAAAEKDMSIKNYFVHLVKEDTKNA